MNKDVIYIEPEHDITDILANIKGAKSKIVALVPPKKSSVLRSAVNFKLISKAATKAEKTVVLITSDESLLRLADSVKMPTAKNLQSKPKLPDTEDATEFGAEPEDAAEEVDEIQEDAPEAAEEAQPEPKDDAKKAKVGKAAKSAAAIAAEQEAVEELTVDDEEKPKADKKKNTKVPNFKKYRKFIIIGIPLIILIVLFFVWANVIAPAATISVKVRTTASNFSKTIELTTDSSKVDPENGVFLMTEKTVEKTTEGEFEATGQKDVGTKATGSITITRPKGETITSNNQNFSIPKLSTFTINGKKYIVKDGGSANVGENQYMCTGNLHSYRCYTTEAISSGKIAVEAAETGDSYNIQAATSGITSSITIPSSYTVTSTAMTGGTSKMIKIVSEDDIKDAEADLPSADNEAREELARDCSGSCVLIGSSFKISKDELSSSPQLNAEVGDNVTPRVVRKVTYSVLTVDRDDIDIFIRAQVAEGMGDNTQDIYSTGLVKEGEEGSDKVFFDNYKEDGGKITAKLKSTVKTGPRVTTEMVAEKSYGEKVGKVKSILTSINGVSGVDIDTSYFWVTSIPSDPNKVEIKITVE